MAKVNLRDLYPHYKGDSFIEIPDEVLAEIEACEREEEAYKRYLRYHKVMQIVDSVKLQKIEADAVDKPPMPHEIMEQRFMEVVLYMAINQLPDKQAKRIYAHYFLGMSKTEIAKAEGVREATVRESINGGLQNLKKYLNFFL